MDYSAAIAAAAKASPSVPNENTVPGRKLIIDGDYAAYASAGSDGMPPGVCRKNLIERIHNARRHSRAASLEVHLSASGCDKGLRGLVSTVKPYQGNRAGSVRPANWAAMRSYLEGLREAVPSSHREADDSMAEAAYADPEGTVLHYADKDLRQLPGWHLTWADHHLFYVAPGTFELVGPDSLIYGSKWLWLQMLQGDTADHIPGLERQRTADGKGWKTIADGSALTELKPCKNNAGAFRVVGSLYEDYYGDAWADRFVEQMALLWLRSEPAAPVVDFFTSPHSVLPRTGPAYQQILDATRRLKKRVKEAHAEIKSITDSAGPVGDFEYTEW